MTNSENFSTYPPYFRPNHHPTGNSPETESESDSHPKPDPLTRSAALPVIDFEALNPAYLSRVCREWGMFRLTNHGVPTELLSQLDDHSNKLFSLDFESKQSLPTAPVLYFWGTAAITMAADSEKQTALYAQNINWLEGFNVPLSKISHSHYEDPVLESFRCLLEEYGGHQTRIAKAIFAAMAKDLNFPPKKKGPYLSPATGTLRVYRYLRCPDADRRWGIPEHTDSSVLSIVHQDQVGGLQVLKNNEWLDVEPIRDTFIVNLGDMMQAMSDNEYLSARHRVKVNRAKERVSIGYFVFPSDDAVIESSKYKPFTYTDFQAEKELDLKKIGKKIGLPRFRKEQPSSQDLI